MGAWNYHMMKDNKAPIQFHVKEIYSDMTHIYADFLVLHLFFNGVHTSTIENGIGP